MTGVGPSPHRLQEAIVPRNGRPNRRVAYIGQGKGVARLGHHGADGGIMDVAYARKQVVLNLKIQPAKIPRDPGVMRGKIRRRLHFMLGPSRGHHTGVRIRGGEAGVLDGMGELKRHRQRHPEEQMHAHEGQEHMLPRMKA